MGATPSKNVCKNAQSADKDVVLLNVSQNNKSYNRDVKKENKGTAVKVK